MARKPVVHWTGPAGLSLIAGEVVPVCGLRFTYAMTPECRERWTVNKAKVTCSRCVPERSRDPA